MIFRFLDDKCWHDISNTNIYIQLTHTPQIVGSIYPIQIYIFKNVHSPTLCPKGTQKPSNLHSSPKCWYNISNTNIYRRKSLHNFSFFNTPFIYSIGKGNFWMQTVSDMVLFLCTIIFYFVNSVFCQILFCQLCFLSTLCFVNSVFVNSVFCQLCFVNCYFVKP